MITHDEQMRVWNTKTLEEFNHLHFDKVLDKQHIEGTERSFRDGGGHLDGYECVKLHKNKAAPSVYFVKSEDIEHMPLIVKNTFTFRHKNKVYNVVYDYDSLRIVPEKIFTWRELVEQSGIPKHSNPLHWMLYRNKVLYGRTKGQLYYRVVSPSAFGKDKYKESLAWLLGGMSILSDPTSPNLFYRACHHRDITINEMPSEKSGAGFIRLCNSLMRIGDASNRLDNASRKTDGTKDTAYTGKLSVSFTHNPPFYYKDVGKDGFDDIFPFNVVNRYYYTLYDGHLQAVIRPDLDYSEVARSHEDFLRKWIKSATWYEAHWHELPNLYPHVKLEGYVFPENMTRFRDNFVDFARCLSYYAKSAEEYTELLSEEYVCYLKYRKMLDPNNGQNLLVTEERVV